MMLVSRFFWTEPGCMLKCKLHILFSENFINLLIFLLKGKQYVFPNMLEYSLEPFLRLMLAPAVMDPTGIDI